MVSEVLLIEKKSNEGPSDLRQKIMCLHEIFFLLI